MKYLFDASALVNVILSTETEEIKRVLKDGIILDLTIYEYLNAMWKLAKVRRIISEEDAINNAKLLSKLLELGIINVIKSENLRKIIKIAYKEYITVYDASYIVCALENKLILVTDDNKLQAVSDKKKLKTLTSDEFLNKVR